jgi:hypothetical protein
MTVEYVAAFSRRIAPDAQRAQKSARMRIPGKRWRRLRL